MPLTSKDPQTLRDIQLIQMREALDPHRHYKKNILKRVPKYSQVWQALHLPSLLPYPSMPIMHHNEAVGPIVPTHPFNPNLSPFTSTLLTFLFYRWALS